MEGGSKGGEEETKSQERVRAEAVGEDNDSILNSCSLSAMQIPITPQTSCWLTLKHPLKRSAFPR